MFLDPCWKCPHSEVHWDGMHGLLEVLITHGLLTAALEPFTSGPSKTKSLGIPVRQCALSPICLWWWALGVVWKTHTKWQNKNVQFPGPGDYKQKQNNNNNKTTTTAKDLWEVRLLQVFKADFLRLDKPSKGFLEKTVFLTLWPLSACGSSSRVDF